MFSLVTNKEGNVRYTENKGKERNNTTDSEGHGTTYLHLSHQ